MVLGVYLGSRNSGGYDIEISNLLEQDNCLEVYVTESTPTLGRATTYAFTQPYHLVKTAKTKKGVKFIKFLLSYFVQ